MHQFGKENFSSQVTSKDLFFDNIKKVQFEFFLKTAGLLSTGVDLKHRYGPIKRDKTSIRLRSLYCRVICSMFWLFTLRQFILMFIGDSYVQVSAERGERNVRQIISKKKTFLTKNCR